jgi:MFS family permease
LADRLWLQLALLTLALGPLGPVFPLFSSIISDVTPPAHRNTMMTMILSIATFAGVPASMVTGHLIDASGAGWTSVLILHGAIGLVAACICFFVINPGRSLAARTAA